MNDLPWDLLRSGFRAWSGVRLPASVRPTLEAALEEMAATNAVSDEEMLRRLATDLEARQILLDRANIGMTWFYREKASIMALVHGLRSSKGSAADVAVWSAGCSSGEEPYTLAMALVSAGMKPRILATDMSRDLLGKGRAATYTPHAAERLPPSWRERFVEETGTGRVRIVDSIRRCVTFELHNFAVADRPPPSWRNFDAVVCRNSLMYFDRADATSVLRKFARATRAGGRLLLGAIEKSLLWSEVPSEPTKKAAFDEDLDVPLRRVRGWERIQPGPEITRGPTTTAHSPELAAVRRGDDVHEVLKRVESLSRRGLVTRAATALADAATRFPLSAPVHLTRGLALKRLGHTDEAVQSLRAARLLDGESWLAPYQLGLLLEATAEPRDARRAYRHALDVLESGGGAGLSPPQQEVEALAKTAMEACHDRLAALQLLGSAGANEPRLLRPKS